MTVLHEMKQRLYEEEEMQSIRDHLLSRGVDPDRIGLVVDEKTNTASFFLYNLSGKLVGYQQYNPRGAKSLKYRPSEKEKVKDLMKYWGHVTGKKTHHTKEIGVWGLDTYDMKAPYLFVVEGIFDAASLHNAGVPAIAVLTNDPDSSLRSWLGTLPQTKIVINDRDESSEKLSSAGDHNFVVPAPYKDLNEMPQEEVNEFVEKIKNDIGTFPVSD